MLELFIGMYHRLHAMHHRFTVIKYRFRGELLDCLLNALTFYQPPYHCIAWNDITPLLDASTERLYNAAVALFVRKIITYIILAAEPSLFFLRAVHVTVTVKLPIFCVGRASYTHPVLGVKNASKILGGHIVFSCFVWKYWKRVTKDTYWYNSIKVTFRQIALLNIILLVDWFDLDCIRNERASDWVCASAVTDRHSDYNLRHQYTTRVL